MSRATDITLFLILLQASIGFVNSTGMFNTSSLASSDYYASNNNSQTYSIDDLNQYRTAADHPPDLWDYFTTSLKWIWDGLLIALNIVLAVVFVFPTLIFTFGIPAEFAIFMQAGIYYMYALWYMQYKSNKPGKLYE